MKRYYIGQKILLRKNLLLGNIVKKLPHDKFLISYYEENKFKYDLITDVDIVDNAEYEIIRNRVNLINRILNS